MADNVTIADHADFALTTQDFTIEFWVRFATAPSATRDLVYQHGGASQRAFTVDLDSSGKLRFQHSLDGTTWVAAASTTGFAANTFTFVAVERHQGILALSVDGVVVKTAFIGTDLIFNSTADFAVGSTGTAGNTWIDDLRLTVGFARYQGKNFTVPTEALPTALGAVDECVSLLDAQCDDEWADVVLLVHSDGIHRSRVWTDETGRHIVRRTSATVIRYPSVDALHGGIFGQGTRQQQTIGIVYTLNNKTDYHFGTGDFTIEIAVDLDVTQRFSTIGLLGYSISASGSGYEDVAWSVRVDATTGHVKLFLQDGAALLEGTSNVIGAGWTQIAVARVSGTAYLFVNGALEDSAASAEDLTGTESPGHGVVIGGVPGFSFNAHMTGWWDEVRITRAGRYSASYTARTTPFPDVAC